MRKFLVPSAVLLLVAVLVAGAAQAGRKADPVKITIGTYVWQPTTVAAMKNIVDSWNKTHSRIAVQSPTVLRIEDPPFLGTSTSP